MTIPSKFKITVFAVSIGNRVVSRDMYFETAKIFQNLPKYQPWETFTEILKQHKLLIYHQQYSTETILFLFILQGIYNNVNPKFYMYFPMSLLPTLLQDVYKNSRKSLYCKSPATGKWFTAQRPNAGYAQMGTFLGSRVQISRAKIYGKTAGVIT